MPNPNHERCKALVSEFVKDPAWSKEIKIAKKLLTYYSFDFLMAANVKDLYSLSFFLTEKGKQTLERTEKLQKLNF